MWAYVTPGSQDLLLRNGTTVTKLAMLYFEGETMIQPALIGAVATTANVVCR
jgi:hypothetical protein